jgi:hypothetical protein
MNFFVLIMLPVGTPPLSSFCLLPMSKINDAAFFRAVFEDVPIHYAVITLRLFLYRLFCGSNFKPKKKYKRLVDSLMGHEMDHGKPDVKSPFSLHSEVLRLLFITIAG